MAQKTFLSPPTLKWSGISPTSLSASISVLSGIVGTPWTVPSMSVASTGVPDMLYWIGIKRGTWKFPWSHWRGTAAGKVMVQYCQFWWSKCEIRRGQSSFVCNYICFSCVKIRVNNCPLINDLIKQCDSSLLFSNIINSTIVYKFPVHGLALENVHDFGLKIY